MQSVVVVVFVVVAVVLLYRDPDHLSLPWTLCFLFFALFWLFSFTSDRPVDRREGDRQQEQHSIYFAYFPGCNNAQQTGEKFSLSFSLNEQRHKKAGKTICWLHSGW